MPSGKAKEARAFGSPSRYIQGPGEINNLPKFAANYGNTALVIIDAFFFEEYQKKIPQMFADCGMKAYAVEFSGKSSDQALQRLVEYTKTLPEIPDTFIGIGGGQTGLQAKPEVLAQAIAAEAAEYDGVLLDVSKLPENKQKAHTALVKALRRELGDKLLYVAAEAPESSGTRYGYDYAALTALADRLILRTGRYETETGGFPTMPQEPLEEVYYALAALSGTADLSRCSLWLTTTGLGRERLRGAVSYFPADRLGPLLADPLTQQYYSVRYADAYLHRDDGNTQTVVWYHDSRAAEARACLGAFFGVQSVCFSEVGEASGELLEGL